MGGLKLYQISDEYQQAIIQLEAMAADGSLPQEAVNDTLDGIKGELKDKCLNVAAYIKHLRAFAEQAKKAEEEIAERRKKAEKDADSFATYLQRHMIESGLLDISDNPYHKLKIKKTPAAVVITGNVPESYMAVKVIETPNKKAIKSAIDGGRVIDFAHLESGTRLEIK
jgi:hypothetical protein